MLVRTDQIDLNLDLPELQLPTEVEAWRLGPVKLHPKVRKAREVEDILQ